MKKDNGITLIALVVTIIMLIILGGVTINLSLGQNGLFNKAKEAKENYKQAMQNEEKILNETAKYVEEVGEGIEKIKTIEEVKGGEYFNKTTTLKDSNGNLIKVPAGFKIAKDSGKNVTEGIVIEDNDIITGIGNNRGNQYVWIPVGKQIKKSEVETIDIDLGRYKFADGTSDKADDGITIFTKGTPILKQRAENYMQEEPIAYYSEIPTSRIGVASNGLDALNTTASNLKGFIDSVKENGGYYIARYEASYGTDGKANSKISNNYSETTEPTTEGSLWNFINQLDAAKASQNLYTVTNTDLINSYAWDTALVYIQNFSDNNQYSWNDGMSINNKLANTGVNGDEKLKINDMASNTWEWTSEYSSYIEGTKAGAGTRRGGNYKHNANFTWGRYSSNVTVTSMGITFRTILYI